MAVTTVKKLKTNDTVQVISGKDKGKTGKILGVDSKEGKILVEGLNLVTRHRKPRRANEKGQKMLKPAVMDASKIMLVCSSCGKASRVGFSISAKGEKARICKKCNKAT